MPPYNALVHEWTLVPLTGPYQKWTGRNAMTGQTITHYCNAAPFAGCPSVPPVLNLTVAGGCFGFFVTVTMTRATDGKYYGSMPVCGGTDTAFFVLSDLPLDNHAYLAVTVAGLSTTLTNSNTGCSPPAWSQSFQTVTLGACCGTFGTVTSIATP